MKYIMSVSKGDIMQLICYLSNGYPTIEDTISRCSDYAAAGADVIEVDLPARNPYLESELIAGRMRSALEKCDSYDEYLEGIQKMRYFHPDRKFLIVVYEDTIKEIGVQKYIDFCLRSEIKDVIVVGSEDKILKPLLMEKGICVSCYVQFHMPENELEEAVKSNGFIYLQAKPVENHINPDYPTLKECINHIRELGISRNIYCGVGIHTLEDIEMTKDAGANGAFVGKVILENDNNREALIKTIKKYKEVSV